MQLLGRIVVEVCPNTRISLAENVGVGSRDAQATIASDLSHRLVDIAFAPTLCLRARANPQCSDECNAHFWRAMDGSRRIEHASARCELVESDPTSDSMRDDKSRMNLFNASLRFQI
jgi:hypothetical protein